MVASFGIPKTPSSLSLTFAGPNSWHLVAYPAFPLEAFLLFPFQVMGLYSDIASTFFKTWYPQDSFLLMIGL